ncbi:MAG: hypothetical protein ACRDDY_03350 [Clostridium sp.]|uniref:hypothetical protein n=1 Tax=Clostridium sp. TaxID=1506 RepID=UPI003EE591D4
MQKYLWKIFIKGGGMRKEIVIGFIVMIVLMIGVLFGSIDIINGKETMLAGLCYGALIGIGVVTGISILFYLIHSLFLFVDFITKL